jgi:broad specificity phosphatase PhoE
VASPLERAQQTATPIAAAHGLEVRTDLRLIETSNVFEGVAGNVAWYILRHPSCGGSSATCAPRPGANATSTWSSASTPSVDAVRAEFAGGHVVLVSHQAPSGWPGWPSSAAA